MSKYIHYFVGKNKEIPPFSEKCLNSWKEYMSEEYEIKLWTLDDLYTIDDDIAVKIARIDNYNISKDFLEIYALYKYGGIYVPPNMAVIHSYNREMMTGCGRMILGSDSHTRYGALGTMGIGEGGGELAKQLLEKTYDIARPEIVLVYVHGKIKPGVGPHDVALAICKETYANGFAKILKNREL